MKRSAKVQVLAAISLAALHSWTGAIAYAAYDPDTNTDTLTNRTISAHPAFPFKEGDLSGYDHSDRNLVINWTDSSRGDGSAIRDANVNAQNITINADFSGNQWTDKGIISDYTTHVTASGDISITTHNDAVYTEGSGTTTIDGFKNLTIKATGNNWWRGGGFGVVDNGGGITIQGGNDSKVDISTVTSVQAAVGNSVKDSTVGTGITISANEINLDAPKLAVYAAPGKNGDFSVKLNASAVTIKGAVEANGGRVVINPDTNGSVTITRGTFQGSFFVSAVPYSILAMGNTGNVSINQNQGGKVQITGDVKADTGASVSVNGTKADSFVKGNLLASQGGTINLKLTGDNSALQGNLTTEASAGDNTNAAITVEFSGNGSGLTGNASNAGSMGLNFDKGSTWTGDLNNTSGISTITLDNSSSWTGNLTSTAGTANARFNNGSIWEGNLSSEAGSTAISLNNGSAWNGTASGNGDITLSGHSLWNLTGDSTASSVNPDTSSLISLAGTAHKLEAQSLGGSGGTFLMDLNYQGDDVTTYRDGDSSDFIVAHGGNGSTYNVAISGDSNVNGMTEGSKLYFASTAADSSAFQLNQNIEVQNYNKIYNKNLSVLKDTNKLSVKKETDNTESDFNGYDNWFLTPDASKGDDGDTINPNGVVPGAAASTAFALWRDNDTLLRRLGELRYHQQDEGVWARLENKQLSRDGAHGFKGNYKTLQVGYDKKYATDKNGDWVYGAAVSHLWGDTDYRTNGHGSQKSTELSLYGTNLRPHGHYLDLIARVGRIDSDYTSSYSDHGKFENWGTSFGAEYGRKKDYGHGWTLEPQAQVTYHYLWGDDYTTKNGARVSQDNADSLVGRLGFVVAKEFNQGTDHAGRVYLKASVLHDFLGGTGSTLVDDIRYRDDDDLGDTWYVAGIGTNIHFGKDTQFYFDAERNFKADVRMKYRFNAGLRFGF